MNKVIVYIILLLVFIALGVTILSPFATAAPSPTVTEHDIRVRYYPSITTNVYRVCNNDGQLVKFFDLRDVSYDLMDDLTDIQSNDKFVFSIRLNTELIDNEYMELIIIDENELIVYNNDVKVPVEKFGEYNIVHIIESGIIRIQ